MLPDTPETCAQRLAAEGSRGMRESSLGEGRGGGNPPPLVLEFREVVYYQVSSHKLSKLEYFALHNNF